MDDKRLRGTIDQWHAARGYGFIHPDDPREQRMFLHHTDLLPGTVSPLPLGAVVDYEIGTDRVSGRTKAVRAERVND